VRIRLDAYPRGAKRHVKHVGLVLRRLPSRAPSCQFSHRHIVSKAARPRVYQVSRGLGQISGFAWHEALRISIRNAADNPSLTLFTKTLKLPTQTPMSKIGHYLLFPIHAVCALEPAAARLTFSDSSWRYSGRTEAGDDTGCVNCGNTRGGHRGQARCQCRTTTTKSRSRHSRRTTCIYGGRHSVYASLRRVSAAQAPLMWNLSAQRTPAVAWYIKVALLAVRSIAIDTSL